MVDEPKKLQELVNEPKQQKIIPQYVKGDFVGILGDDYKIVSEGVVDDNKVTYDLENHTDE